MIYFYAIIAGSSDLLAEWFELTREDKFEARYIITFPGLHSGRP